MLRCNTMIKKKDNIWTWLQSKGKIFKVIYNTNKGIITVYDENDKILMKKTNLTKEQIEKVEDSFLDYVAKKINNINVKRYPWELFDPMIA